MDFMYRNEPFEQQNIELIKHETFEQNTSKCIEHTKTKPHRNARETSEERKIRREKDRLRIAAARARETVEERNARLAIERERKRTMRAREDSESKEIRNAKNRMRQAINRANETFVEAQARKINDRIRHMERRSRETLEEREIRLAKDRARHRKYRCKTIKKESITETNRFCAEIPSDINNQVPWLRLRESLVNIKHSPQSTNVNKEELPPSKFQIKEESINIDDKHVFGFTAQETKNPLNIKIEPNSDIKPYSDSIHELSEIEPIIVIGSESNNLIKKENNNFISGNVKDVSLRFKY